MIVVSGVVVSDYEAWDYVAEAEFAAESVLCEACEVGDGYWCVAAGECDVDWVVGGCDYGG